MGDQAIENPVTGQRVTFTETARETGGARTVADIDTTPGEFTEFRIVLPRGAASLGPGRTHRPASSRGAR